MRLLKLSEHSIHCLSILTTAASFDDQAQTSHPSISKTKQQHGSPKADKFPNTAQQSWVCKIKFGDDQSLLAQLQAKH